MKMPSIKTVKLTPEEREKVRAYVAGAQPLVAGGLLFLLLATFLLLTDKVNLSGRTKIHELVDFGSKLQFLSRYAVLHASWLLFAMFYVISFRAATPAVNPMSGYEHLTLAANKIFSNSIEQSMISIFTQFALITFAEPHHLLRLIPLLNMLYLVGRIAFFAGYPKRRAFGFTVNVVPIAVVNVYVFFKFIAFLMSTNPYY